MNIIYLLYIKNYINKKFNDEFMISVTIFKSYNRRKKYLDNNTIFHMLALYTILQL